MVFCSCHVLSVLLICRHYSYDGVFVLQTLEQLISKRGQMAAIAEGQQFNVDSLSNQVIGIATEVGQHDSGMHKHNKGQLLYAPAGCISITLDGMQSVLPPTRVAWIPAGMMHCARMRNVVSYRSFVIFQCRSGCVITTTMCIVEVNILLQALIERMAFWPWDKPEREQANTLTLFCDELAVAPVQQLHLPLPKDLRLQTWLMALVVNDLPPQPLDQLQTEIGASGKTISRIFSRETGMPYQAWRQQWRLLNAIERLAEGLRISMVTFDLDFTSDSAFISFFRQHIGSTPAKYLSDKTRRYDEM
ncbi:MAG: AraC-like DNA-binding protein [Moritella dasanensis]